MNTRAQWLERAIARLRNEAATESPELDAQLLVCHVLKISRAALYAYPEMALSASLTGDLEHCLTRRINGEPLAHITGVREFWSTELMVSSDTLVPRPDTEVLVEKALELDTIAPEGLVVDLGTGTGAIAIALARELPERHIVAVECSRAALRVAQLNTRAQAMTNLSLVHASWLDSVADDSLAMVVANPPYLANDDAHLPQLAYEPREALVSGNTGFESLDHIIAETKRAARHGAALILEHGSDQGTHVRQQLLDYSYTRVGMGLDLAALDRISFGFVAKKAI